ncbi:MAG: glycosyltransferase family 9 protein [Taibaiella sp.]|nr:glycosyltransferase family 9 protein [Taibaiella sp.]
MKLLVIRFSSIGDIVLTTPVVRCLKQQLPGVEIHYLTKAAYKEVLIANPYIDKLHYLHDDIGKMIPELLAEKFDYIIDLHNNLRTLQVKKALNTHQFSFPKLNFQKWLLVNFKIDLMPSVSIVERYMETVVPLGIHNDEMGLDYFIPEDVKVGNSDIPMSHWGGYTACVIGGSYKTKKLPAAQWEKFCAATPYPIILMGGAEDKEQGAKIAAKYPIKVYNSCGKFSLNESAWLLKHAKVVASNDTGLMHIAAAFKKPVISLWGNTSSTMGMFPYYGNNDLAEKRSPFSMIMEKKKLYCHPCSKLGYNKCPEKHFKCMNNLNMSDLEENVNFFWRNPNQ